MLTYDKVWRGYLRVPRPLLNLYLEKLGMKRGFQSVSNSAMKDSRAFQEESFLRFGSPFCTSTVGKVALWRWLSYNEGVDTDFSASTIARLVNFS